MRLISILLVMLAIWPVQALAQIPGAVFSSVCVTENQLIDKFGSKRSYDVWRMLHTPTIDLTPVQKLKITKSAQEFEEVSPYAIHQFKRREARFYEELLQIKDAAKIYEWLADSSEATKTERKTARSYAKKLRDTEGKGFQENPPIKSMKINFTQSARQKKKSGFCIASFDIDGTGQAQNAELELCTSRYFKKSMMKTVRSIKFDPTGVEQTDGRHIMRVDFNLMDKCGNLLPK